jgi:hypothetical protein
MRVTILNDRPRGKAKVRNFAAYCEEMADDGRPYADITLSEEQAEALCDWLVGHCYGVLLRRKDGAP